VSTVRQLSRVEWDFPRVRGSVDSQGEIIWEYARSFLKPSTLELRPKTGAIRWLITLRSQIPVKDFLRVSWTIVMPDHKGWLQSRLTELLKAPADADKVEMIVPPAGWTQAVTVKPGLSPTKLALEIDLLADPTTIAQQVAGALWCAQYIRSSLLLWDAPSQDKEKRRGRPIEWSKALPALGAYRLKRSGHTFAQIARLRKRFGAAGTLLSLERAAKRDLITVAEFRDVLFGRKASLQTG